MQIDLEGKLGGDVMARTKMDLAYAFIKQLETKKIKDVTIGDICLEANYSRETFYYHFQNKYDLIAWMHYFEKSSYFKTYFGKKDFTDIVAMILKDMMKVEFFYIRCFEDSVNTQIEEIMMTQTIEIYSDMAKTVLKQDELTTELEMSIYYSVYGSVMLIKEWFLTENDLDYMQMAEFITKSMNENLRELFYGYSQL